MNAAIAPIADSRYTPTIVITNVVVNNITNSDNTAIINNAINPSPRIPKDTANAEMNNPRLLPMNSIKLLLILMLGFLIYMYSKMINSNVVNIPITIHNHLLCNASWKDSASPSLFASKEPGAPV